MNCSENEFNERVVKLVETCDGAVERTFYCIRDTDMGYWMSNEPFDGLIWTRDVSCRQEFASREDAEDELECFLDWRQEQEAHRTPVVEILIESVRARAKVA